MTADKFTGKKPPYVWHGTIQLGDLPRNPSIAQADEVMRIVSEHCGGHWYAVKLSGWWSIICREAGVGWGAVTGQRTRNFARVLAEATRMPVVRDIPDIPVDSTDHDLDQDLIVDHSTCPPDAHDRDPGTSIDDGQPVDDHGLMLCRDCLAPLMFCTTSNHYAHVDPSAPSCFLVAGNESGPQ